MTSLAGSPPAKTRENVCIVCRNETRQRCSKCKAVRFCSKNCQEILWDGHKSVCKSIAKEPEATVLLLDGMSMFGPGTFYTKAVQAALARAGTKVATIDVTKGFAHFQQVASILCELNRLTSFIVLGLGRDCEEDTLEDFSENHRFREELLVWVQQGGRFIVQGDLPEGEGPEGEEPDTICNWPGWFEQTWEAEYHTQGSTHDCHASFGEGSVSYFGNIHAEDDTCDKMAVIARGP